MRVKYFKTIYIYVFTFYFKKIKLIIKYNSIAYKNVD